MSEALLNVIESGETDQLDKDMLDEIESGEKDTSCSPVESNKEKDNSSIGFHPFLGLFCICSTIAILALLYNMVCLLVKNVETLTSHILVILTQLWRIKRWATPYFARCYSKLQAVSMRRRVSNTAETRNAEEMVTNQTVTNSQQIKPNNC